MWSQHKNVSHSEYLSFIYVKVAFMQYVFPFRNTQCGFFFLKITTQRIESRSRSRCLEVLPTPPLRPWQGSGGGDARIWGCPFLSGVKLLGLICRNLWAETWGARLRCSSCSSHAAPPASLHQTRRVAAGAPFLPTPSRCSSDLSPSPRRHVCQWGFAALISTS